MAEGHEAGHTEQQIQAGGEHGEDDDVRRQERVVTRAEDRNEGRDHEQDQRPGDAFRQAHFTGLPINPQGRTMRTTAMITNAAKMEKRGKIKMPKASVKP